VVPRGRAARSPLVDSTLLRDDAVVVAIGSHQHDARALDAPLLGRATVVVEDVTATLDEAGDVVLAGGEGALTGADRVPVLAS
jgi:ornithine cyclodeaminase/alanine dehydrogenase-like protein (mu-crystallin family)